MVDGACSSRAKTGSPRILNCQSRRETLERIDLRNFLFLQWDTKDDDHFQKEVEEKGRQCRDEPNLSPNSSSKNMREEILTRQLKWPSQLLVVLPLILLGHAYFQI